MAIDAKTFGRQLQKARERAKLTQEDVVAKLAARGFEFTQGGYSHYEKGRRFPDPPVIAAIADIVGTSTDYLMLRTTVESPISEIIEELETATGGGQISKLMQQLPKDKQQQVITFAQFLNYLSGNSGATASLLLPPKSPITDAQVTERAFSDQLALRALFVVMRRRLGEEELNRALDEVAELAPEWEELIARGRGTSKDSSVQSG